MEKKSTRCTSAGNEQFSNTRLCRTIGWEIKEGRDFSRDFPNDSASIILNEAAVKLMGFEHPLEEMVSANGKDYKVIAVTKDMIKENPFAPVNPSFYRLNY